MPQMSNMDWFFLMNYFLFIFLLCLTMIYFLIMIHLFKNNKNLKMNKFNLKWY